jgi:hypothetical protein
MKNPIQKIAQITAFTVLFFSFASCKKDQTASPAPVTMAQLLVHLHTNIDTSEVDTSTASKDATGRRIKIKLAQFYASGIRVQKSDGSWLPMTGLIILKTIPNEQYVLGNVPTGNYQSIAFNVGLDATTNSGDPGTQAAGSVLGVQNPSMWFGSTAQGYIFMNIQGMVDTSAGNNGTVNFPISYQLGTSTMLKSVTLPSKTYAVVANQANFVHLICDYGKALAGVNFKTQNMASPWSNATVATQIANNVPGMFRYE